jgi:hypothetical protein
MRNWFERRRNISAGQRCDGPAAHLEAHLAVNEYESRPTVAKLRKLRELWRARQRVQRLERELQDEIRMSRIAPEIPEFLTRLSRTAYRSRPQADIALAPGEHRRDDSADLDAARPTASAHAAARPIHLGLSDDRLMRNNLMEESP